MGGAAVESQKVEPRENQSARQLRPHIVERSDAHRHLAAVFVQDVDLVDPQHPPGRLLSAGGATSHRHLDLVSGTQAGRQILFGPLRDDFTSLDHQQAIAGLADLGEEVARDEQGVVAAQPPDEIAHLDDLHRVEPRGRLVQDEQRGPMDHRLRQPDPLAIPVRQAADELVVHVAQGRFLFHLADAGGSVLGRHPSQSRREGQVRTDRHLPVERGDVRQEADLATNVVRVGQHVVPIDHHLARRGQKEAAEDLERGGFSGAVEPEESDHLASLDVEAEISNCRVFAVILGELTDLNHGKVGRGISQGLAETKSSAKLRLLPCPAFIRGSRNGRLLPT